MTLRLLFSKSLLHFQHGTGEACDFSTFILTVIIKSWPIIAVTIFSLVKHPQIFIAQTYIFILTYMPSLTLDAKSEALFTQAL